MHTSFLLKWTFSGKIIQMGLIGLLSVFGARVGFSQTKADEYLLISNKLNINRDKEVICVNKNDFASIPVHSYPLLKQGNKVCISQLVDEDMDGQWDELLVEVSIKALAKDKIAVIWIKKVDYPNFEKATNIRFSLKSKTQQPEKEINYLERQRGFTQNIANPAYQMEGPGIENDKIAFRSFFDKRNGKDIYGKLMATPVLDEVGLTGSWHTLQSWGMDILRTGNSLGAGALGVKQQGKIFRLADADNTTFKALYEGPLKACYKLDFTNWDVAALLKNGTEQLSITRGDYFYFNQVKLNLAESQHLISGMANFGTNPFVYKKHNKKFSSVSLYGPQADGTQTKLGLAILFQANQYAGHATTLAADSIPNTSYIALKPVKKEMNSLRFFACWEKTDTMFSTKEGFEKYLQETADRLANPIEITVIQHTKK
ncbi:DUF4861 domain-containing protein [Pedobacter frigiditerrae]|uniref:DUF4861 domain-containing protein n=1 Tax=Pedobacter frigiditerrae TaxID=2530452 RepID=A0A4R0MQZ7_9SPHI|nr:DUF4861 family protein [Pedobacter frigiditerrae]TCC88702.1 DUF4861 domain-containing protein [Pedobacter frigiditerrae]